MRKYRQTGCMFCLSDESTNNRVSDHGVVFVTGKQAAKKVLNSKLRKQRQRNRALNLLPIIPSWNPHSLIPPEEIASVGFRA
jgi:hypothetical protein